MAERLDSAQLLWVAAGAAGLALCKTVWHVASLGQWLPAGHAAMFTALLCMALTVRWHPTGCWRHDNTECSEVLQGPVQCLYNRLAELQEAELALCLTDCPTSIAGPSCCRCLDCAPLPVVLPCCRRQAEPAHCRRVLPHLCNRQTGRNCVDLPLAGGQVPPAGRKQGHTCRSEVHWGRGCSDPHLEA